jgi:hypothetical protein
MNDSVEKRLIERQLFEFCRLEGYKFLAQRLQRKMISLACAFAGLRVVHPLSYLVAGPASNPA